MPDAARPTPSPPAGPARAVAAATTGWVRAVPFAVVADDRPGGWTTAALAVVAVGLHLAYVRLRPARRTAGGTLMAAAFVVGAMATQGVTWTVAAVIGTAAVAVAGRSAGAPADRSADAARYAAVVAVARQIDPRLVAVVTVCHRTRLWLWQRLGGHRRGLIAAALTVAAAALVARPPRPTVGRAVLLAAGSAQLIGLARGRLRSPTR